MARGGCLNEMTYKKRGGGRWRPRITWNEGITSTLSEQISSQPFSYNRGKYSVDVRAFSKLALERYVDDTIIDAAIA